MWRYNDFRIIDCHVHACHLQDRASFVFPEIGISEVCCKQGHIVRLQEVQGDTYKFVCSTCGRLVYSGEDPYRRYNEELLASSQDNELIFPYVSISPQIKRDIQYYTNKYGSRGFKLHPNYSSYKIDLCEVPSGILFVIHSGKGEFDNPMRILDFARHCQGTVIIAHLGRMNKELFDNIKRIDNVVLECSPVTSLWEAYKNHTGQVYDASFLGELRSPEEMLQRVMEYVGCEKVVYGSDTPIESASEDLAVIQKLPTLLKKKILYKNILSLLSLKASGVK